MSVDVARRFKDSIGWEYVKYRISGNLMGSDKLSTAREFLEEAKVMVPAELFEDSKGCLVPQVIERSITIADAYSDEDKPCLRIRPHVDHHYSAELSTPTAGSANTPTPAEQYQPMLDDAFGIFEATTSEDSNATVTSRTSYFDPTSAQNAHTLSHENRAVMIANSPLGCGVNLSSDETGCYGRPVIKPVPPQDVYFASSNTTSSTSIITPTAREATYAAGGWYEGGIDAESPWVKGHINSDVGSTVKKGDAYVTGRYTHTFCQMRLPEDLEAHPSLLIAVRKALKQTGDEKRREALKAVFARWGYFFIDGVSMGGTKYMSCITALEQNTSTLRPNALVQSALMRKIHPSTNFDTNTAEDSNPFDSGILMTRGGHIGATSLDAWTASLMNWKLWRCTRPTSIRTVIELFDEEIQSQINALEPPSRSVESTETSIPDLAKLAIPLYHVNYPGHNNFYSTDYHRDITRHLTQYGGHDEGIVGRVLPFPVGGSVPFYRTWNDERHFYTADPVEFEDRVTNYKAHVHHHAGYVFRTQVEGTIPLYHIYHVERRQHGYLTDLAHVERCCQNHQYKRRGIACYLFPA